MQRSTLKQQPTCVAMAPFVDQRIKMKVQWIRNGCTWWSLLLISTFCMLMQRQQLAIAAMVPASSDSVDSEILTSSNTNNDQSVWPPMKHHDIWNEVAAKKDFQNSDENENGIYLDSAVETDRSENYYGSDLEFVENNVENITNRASHDVSFEGDESWNNASLDSIIGVQRQSKVFRIFSVPVDGECLSDDGRRTGTCLNIYQCRQKGGTAKGDCAMGFGVCCVFIVNCNETVSNNITYLVSPQFPSFMPNNFTSCSISVKLMSDEISQLRIDFYHFSLGQPNRRTGVCDGDIFNVSGGPGGTFSLCGQNSGQHIYYDVGGRFLPRQTLYGSIRPPTLSQLYPNQNGSDATEQLINISMNFAQRFLPIRLWEIRIAQIPFSQRAPAGCLQYHLGTEGVIQTFNFADNGRHLANQHYRVCMRQETEMCSIMYQPCDEQSFRIGPSRPMRGFPQQPLSGTGGSGLPGMMGGAIPSNGQATMPTNLMMGIMTPSNGGSMGVVMPMPGSLGQPIMPPTSMVSTMAPASAVAIDAASTAQAQVPTTPANLMRSSTAAPTAEELATTAASMPEAASQATAAPTTAPPATMEPMTAATTTAAPTTRASMAPASMTTAEMQAMDSSTAAVSTTAAPTAASTATTIAESPASTERTTTTTTTIRTTTTTTTTTTPSSSSSPASLLSDDVEGSGGEELPGDPGKFRPTRRPRPASGGFDLLGFLRSAFEFRLRRNARKSPRQQRQIYSTCSDRITLPCIVEDFIGTGLGPIPSCEPVHCGTQFCATGTWPCRVESTVTPFFLNIHFGNGIGKGSAEDNIGACLRYSQVQCT